MLEASAKEGLSGPVALVGELQQELHAARVIGEESTGKRTVKN
jgi:hypothetical protein